MRRWARTTTETLPKNDPSGRGMRCWLPKLGDIGGLCPHRLLVRWCHVRDLAWPGHLDGPLFCVAGKPTASQLSYDSWRKAVTIALGSGEAGTHSLRKGGARWLKLRCNVPDEIVQAQGGCSSASVMLRFYAKFSDSERREQLLAAVFGVDAA